MKNKLLFEEHIMSAILIVMLIVLFVNVVGRYVFNWSLAFTEELVVYLFVVVSIIGASAACARGANMGLSIVTDNLSVKYRKLFLLVSAASSIVLFAFLFYQGCVDMEMMYSMSQNTPIMQMPVWVFTAAFPLGSALFIYRVIRATMDQMKELSK